MCNNAISACCSTTCCTELHAKTSAQDFAQFGPTALMSDVRTWTPQLWWCMTWEQVAVATSHKQIWPRAVGSCEEPEGRQAEAMRLPLLATARQVMMPVLCCCRHLHHSTLKQGCHLHTGFCMTCSVVHQLVALSSQFDGNMMNMALQHASVSAEVVSHCHHSHY